MNASSSSDCVARRGRPVAAGVRVGSAGNPDSLVIQECPRWHRAHSTAASSMPPVRPGQVHQVRFDLGMPVSESAPLRPKPTAIPTGNPTHIVSYRKAAAPARGIPGYMVLSRRRLCTKGSRMRAASEPACRLNKACSRRPRSAPAKPPHPDEGTLAGPGRHRHGGPHQRRISPGTAGCRSPPAPALSPR